MYVPASLLLMHGHSFLSGYAWKLGCGILIPSGWSCVG